MKFHLFLLAFSIAVAAVLAADDDEEWTEFKLKYGKSYTNDTEESNKKSIYLTNKQLIKEHNEKYDAGESTYKLKMNSFGDMSAQEYLTLMTVKRKEFPKIVTRNGTYASFEKPKNTTVPDCHNWVTEGAVTPVRNQDLKACGSCYAFACAGALEGQYFIKNHVLKHLSVQEIIDCTEIYDNHGCSGGLEFFPFQYVADQGGISTEEEYPYKATEGTCKVVLKDQKENPDASIVLIETKDMEEIKLALAHIGPLTSGMDAKHNEFRFYSEGIYKHPECEKEDINLLNHSILMVGYCKDSQGREYWLVKNSFGADWGENGYFKLFIEREKSCGASLLPSYPIV